MTRIFTDGAEMQDVAAPIYYSGSGSLTVVNTTPFVSPYYYRLAWGYMTIALPAAVSEIYIRERFRIN
jgi:hypothetical protein